MGKLLDIPFSVDLKSLIYKLRLEDRPEDTRALEYLVERATVLGNPKAVYTISSIKAFQGDVIKIDCTEFRSRVLADNLSGLGRVFPFVVTCGHELDEGYSETADLLEAFWWDTIMARMLDYAARFLFDYLSERYHLPRVSSMSPGSGDVTVWPIEQQRQLFDLLGDVESVIGVRLTESCAMIPNKTISGIAFPSAKDYFSCMVCNRADCPSRIGPTDAELWRKA